VLSAAVRAVYQLLHDGAQCRSGVLQMAPIGSEEA